MNLPEKRKLHNKLLYYLSEIIIVTIGIFIAIQLNNLNDTRKQREESRQSLKRIYIDLYMEKAMIDTIKSQLNRSDTYLKNIVYNNNTDHLDSLLFHLGQVFNHVKMNSEYINLKSSGNLQLIENDKLRTYLVQYYEGYYYSYQQLMENHKRYVSRYIQDYCMYAFPSDTSSMVPSELVLEKLQEVQLRNMIIDQLTFFKTIQATVNTAYIDKLLEMITPEIY